MMVQWKCWLLMVGILWREYFTCVVKKYSLWLLNRGDSVLHNFIIIKMMELKELSSQNNVAVQFKQN